LSVHRLLLEKPSDIALLQNIPETNEGRKIMAMKLYVGNLSWNTTNQDLIELFNGVGPVTSANIIEDRETGRSRGFGFVEMENQSDGENAIAQLHGKEIDGRELKVNEAKPQGDGGRGGSRGGFRGGNSRGGGGGYGGGRSDYGGKSW
jgi:RNA recognition motif-containing protein